MKKNLKIILAVLAIVIVAAPITALAGGSSQTNYANVKPKMTASASYSSITLNWSQAKGCDYYQLYRCTGSSSSSYSLVATTPSTSYCDRSVTVSQTYYYKVRAVSSSRGKTQFCSVVSSKPSIPKPNITSITAVGSKAVTVSWSQHSSATGYQLQRATVVNGQASSWTTVTSSTSTSYTDSKVTFNSTTYAYRVRVFVSVSGKYVYGSYSNQATVKCNSAKPAPQPVTPVKPVAPVCNSGSYVSQNQVCVQWNQVAGASGYDVYCANGSGQYVCVGSNVRSTSYTTSVRVQTTYVFVVKSYVVSNGRKVYSNYSNKCTVRPGH
jgi:hypothetical protein